MNPIVLLLLKKSEVDPVVGIVLLVIVLIILGISQAMRDPDKWYGEMACRKCGYRWQSRRKTPPARCPRCSATLITIQTPADSMKKQTPSPTITPPRPIVPDLSEARMRAQRLLDEHKARLAQPPSKTISKDEALKILSLQTGASREEVSAAYHELVKKYHPDKVAHLGDEFKVMAEEKTKAINQAYRILTSATLPALPDATTQDPATEIKDDPEDELFDQAVEIVTSMTLASTSVLQRRLSIGYGRAAKMLDMMEKRGFIAPASGSKPRRVFKAAYDYRNNLSVKSKERQEAP